MRSSRIQNTTTKLKVGRLPFNSGIYCHLDGRNAIYKGWNSQKTPCGGYKPKRIALPVKRLCDRRTKRRKRQNASNLIHHRMDLCLSGSLAVTAHDLHFLRRNSCLVVQLEVDILDQEGPNFVAESISIEVTLQRR